MKGFAEGLTQISFSDSNTLASNRLLTPSLHIIWKGPPEDLLKFISGRDTLNLVSVLTFQNYKNRKVRRRLYPNLLRTEILKLRIGIGPFPNTRKGGFLRRFCPNLFWAEILKASDWYLTFPNYKGEKVHRKRCPNFF